MQTQKDIPTKQPRSNLYVLMKAIFLVFVIILALVTYFSGHSATIVQDNEANTFLYKMSTLLAPIFVPLIVLNIAVLVLLCLRKSLWLLVPCLAIAINWSIIPSIIQVRGTPSTNELANSLTLQSYNVHRFAYGSFDNTVDNILFSTYRNEVDILCLQEYAGHRDEANKKESMATIDSYVRNSNKLYKNDTISESSSGSSFSKVFPYSCFSDQDNRVGLAIFSLYPIVHSERYNFPESNHEALLADIEINGKLLRVITVHLQTTSISQHDREVRVLTEGLVMAEASSKRNALSTLTRAILENSSKRKSQVDMICKLIEKSPHPVIVCGDLNDTPNSYSYYKFEHLLNDAFKTVGSGYGFSYVPLGGYLRIDYVFHSNNIDPMQFYYKPYPWSDHSATFFRFYFSTTVPVEVL